MIPNLKRRFAEGGEWAKDEISAVMSDVACPVCHGKRLKPEVLAVTVGGKNIIELTELSVTKALAFFDELELSEREQFIAARIVKEIKERLGFLNNVGLEYLTLSRNAGTLSGGEQQMLAVGRALLSRPQLMMMDEPSLGLAPLIIKDIFNIIQEINSRGMTILLIEQNANMALKVAHQAYVLETGKITMSGTGQELLENPDIKAAYLGKKRNQK